VTEPEPEKKGEPGTVVDLLPSATFVVELEARRRVKAHLGPATKLNASRLRVGDKVWVEVSPHDPTRGRIVRFIRSGGE
jgi:translation initiation factor IF-1